MYVALRSDRYAESSPINVVGGSCPTYCLPIFLTTSSPDISAYIWADGPRRNARATSKRLRKGLRTSGMQRKWIQRIHETFPSLIEGSIVFPPQQPDRGPFRTTRHRGILSIFGDRSRWWRPLQFRGPGGQSRRAGLLYDMSRRPLHGSVLVISCLSSLSSKLFHMQSSTAQRCDGR